MDFGDDMKSPDVFEANSGATVIFYIAVGFMK